MPLLELINVRRDFGGVRAIDGIDLAVETGELRALVGPNGCGKSTLFNLVAGALRPTAGRIRFAGSDIAGLAPHRIARLGVVRKFQVASVFPDLTVEQNLTVAGRAGRRPRPSIDALLRRIGLAGKGDELAGALSHGQIQWLEIGMVLAAGPRLMLLDEPTAGMSVSETQATVHLIRDIASSGDVAVLVIEHDVGFLANLDCPVTVLAGGRILRTGSFAEVRADPEVRRLYFGLPPSPMAGAQPDA